MNKRFGLMKLKKISGAQNQKWMVSPHIVLQTPEQLTREKLNGATRALVRTDEKGKRYHTLSWATMPRFDTNLKHPKLGTKIPLKKIQQEIHNKEEFRAALEIPYKKKRVLIIHPTRPREQIAYSGQILINNALREITLKISKTPGKNETHRNLTQAKLIFYKIKNGRLTQTKMLNQDGYTPIKRKINFPKEMLLSRRIKAFLEKGIREHQINPKRGETEISFVTWKDNPTKIEFYDLIEFREIPSEQYSKLKA